MNETIDTLMDKIFCSVKTLDSSKDNIIKWINFLDYMMDKVNINDNRMRTSVILHMLDFDAFSYIWTHVEPENPFNIPYETILSILEEKYSPYGKFHTITSRFVFRGQYSDEFIENYFRTLRRLNKRFDCSHEPDLILLPCFINGLKSRKIFELCKHFESKITIYDAVAIAIKLEYELEPSTRNAIVQEKSFNLINELETELQKLHFASNISNPTDKPTRADFII